MLQAVIASESEAIHEINVLLRATLLHGNPQKHVIARHKARQSTKHKAEYIASPYGSQ